MTETPETPAGAAPSALVAGLTCRCPRCGRGALFRSLLVVRERCESCGLDYKFIDTGDGPAFFAIILLGFTVLGGALWMEFRFEPPFWAHIVVWGILTPLIAVVMLRFLKALLIALQYRNKAEQGRLARD